MMNEHKVIEGDGWWQDTAVPHSRLLNREWLIQRRDLMRELVVRDMKVRYKHSVLGFAWSMATPLLQLLVYYVVFGYLLPRQIPHYATYIFTALLAFIWFQNSLMQAAAAITGNRELVKRPGFATAILPLVTVITNMVSFLLSLPVLLVFLFLEGARPQWAIVGLPVLIILQFVFTLGLSYFVASLNVIFRDTQHLLSVLLRLLFFLTPIFYQVSMLPDKAQIIFRLNPLVALVDAYRAMFIGNTAVAWETLLIPTSVSIILLVVGYRTFNLVRHRFVEEL